EDAGADLGFFKLCSRFVQTRQPGTDGRSGIDGDKVLAVPDHHAELAVVFSRDVVTLCLGQLPDILRGDGPHGGTHPAFVILRLCPQAGVGEVLCLADAVAVLALERFLVEFSVWHRAPPPAVLAPYSRGALSGNSCRL